MGRNITPAIVPYSPVSYLPVNKQVTLNLCSIYNTMNTQGDKIKAIFVQHREAIALVQQQQQ